MFNKGNNKKLVWRIVSVVILILIIVAVVMWIFHSPFKVNKDTYQAVFLTNGQVYFGKIHDANGDYVKLTDVYYLQLQNLQNQQTGSAATTATTTGTDKTQNQLMLMKLGGELHGPRDGMEINQKQILFIEDLRGDSNVIKGIKDYQAKQK